MIEIAISLAIVAVAMVAILGILPTGLTVQKENREDTIIDQEAEYYMNIIRNSGMGAGPLFMGRHVDLISITETNHATGASIRRLFSERNTTGLGYAWDSRQVIRKLLSTPSWDLGQFDQVPDAIFSPDSGVVIESENVVRAVIKAITGNATDFAAAYDDLAFRYEMQVSLHPVLTPALFSGYGLDAGPSTVYDNLSKAGIPGQGELLRQAALGSNLWEVELTMRWPVTLVNENQGIYAVGNNKRSFRTYVAGSVVEDPRNRTLFQLNRGQFTTQ